MTTYKLSQRERQAAEVEAIEKELADAQSAPPAGDLEPAPPAPPAPVAPVQPPPQPAQTTEAQWQQRYQTLEGKYRAEVPRLHSQVKDLTTRLEEALTAIDSLKKPAAAPTAPLVTDKDTETFGADLIDLIARKATELFGSREQALKSEIDALRAENAQFKATVTGVTKSQEASAQQVYLTKLAVEVPDWETINVDPAFLAWLGEVDPMSGLTRQAYVDNAWQTLDVGRTAVIFNAWKAIKAAEQPPAPPAPPAPHQDIQRQVEPGKSKSPSITPTPDAQSRIWTMAEVEQFYADARAGKITPAETAKIEAELDLAVAQGRIK